LNNGWARVLPKPNPPRHLWRWILAVLLLGISLGALAIHHVISNAAPILRSRVVETLSAHFKSKVELAELDVSFNGGLGVHGEDLEIFGQSDPSPYEPGIQPLISVRDFRFHVALRSLFQSPMRVHTVQVRGLTVNIPPKEDIRDVSQVRRFSQTKSIVVDELACEDTQLAINNRNPAKPPLIFEIINLKMEAIGRDRPMPFEATLVNPKPVGDVKSVGQFGPFREDKPRDTPVSGDYSFTHADLGTIRGIGGMLSSTGKFRGVLGRIEVEGTTDTPDFRLARSGHAVHLHTVFHAVVDGTDGDTYLEPVQAQFLHSSFSASGKVIRVRHPHGHDIELNVVMDHARIEDLLQLGVNTEPPVLSGAVALTSNLSLPPGARDVSDRLQLRGSFVIPEGRFSNEKIQNRIDALSLRGQGGPKLAKEHAYMNVASELSGAFSLTDGVFSFSQLHFSVPGARSTVHGTYSLDGNTFDFHGKLAMDAKLSEMTTGWKAVLLKPVDPFFSKHGAGAEIPFKITGTRSAPRFGLDFGHKNVPAGKKRGRS
jgi:AsmA-like C-terminal region